MALEVVADRVDRLARPRFGNDDDGRPRVATGGARYLVGGRVTLDAEQFAFERGRRTGLDVAAMIAESMSYFAVARAIRAGGSDDMLHVLLRDRMRTVLASSALQAGALHSLVVERVRQEKIHPGEPRIDGTGGALAEELCRVVQRWSDDLDGKPENSFAVVLVEEVLEALAETELEPLRLEVKQVGAVAVRWLEDLDRRLSR
jgi:hypothetical protein